MKRAVIIGLGAATIVLAMLSIVQYFQLRALREAPPPEAVAPQEKPAPLAEEVQPSPPETERGEKCASRARIKERYDLNPNGSIRFSYQTVSVDGKELHESTVRNDRDGSLGAVMVSLDCGRVAWALTPVDSYNEAGTQVKPALVRVKPLPAGAVQEFTLPSPGPVSLHPFAGDQLAVSVGAPEPREYDVPQETDLEGTFYRIDLPGGKIETLGGPHIAMSPDFQYVVRRLNNTISLQTKDGRSTVVLADRAKKEYATDFAFSPDSRRLAYLRLRGAQDLIFAKLFRPVSREITEEIIPGELLVREVSGPNAGREKSLISGGYTVDSFRVGRWVASTILEWTKPEATQRVYLQDVTKDEQPVKNGLIDTEAI